MSWLQAFTEFFPLQELQDRKRNKGMVLKGGSDTHRNILKRHYYAQNKQSVLLTHNTKDQKCCVNQTQQGQESWPFLLFLQPRWGRFYMPVCHFAAVSGYNFKPQDVTNCTHERTQNHENFSIYIQTPKKGLPIILKLQVLKIWKFRCALLEEEYFYSKGNTRRDRYHIFQKIEIAKFKLKILQLYFSWFHTALSSISK